MTNRSASMISFVSGVLLLAVSPAQAVEYQLPADGGWYQVQTKLGDETLCDSTDKVCDLPEGEYVLINHHLSPEQNGRHEALKINHSKICSSEKFNIDLSVSGWYQLQSLPNFDTVCYTNEANVCTVYPGEYVLVNHKPKEFEDYRQEVSVTCDGVTYPQDDYFREGLQSLVIPDVDVPLGEFSRTDFVKLIKPMAPIFWEQNNGKKSVSVANVDGKRALVIDLNNSRIPSTRAGGGVKISPARQMYRVVQRLRVDPNFSYGGTNEGGKLGFGISGGSRKTGGKAGPFDEATQTGFSSRLMWREGGHLYSYTYDANTFGYGESEALDFKIVKGEWFDTAMEVTMNSAPTAADGRLRIWINDVLVLDKSDYEWFGRGAPQIDSLLLFVFHGADSSNWSPTHNSQLYISDVFHGPGPFPF